jgi:hypothetical protein
MYLLIFAYFCLFLPTITVTFTFYFCFLLRLMPRHFRPFYVIFFSFPGTLSRSFVVAFTPSLTLELLGCSLTFLIVLKSFFGLRLIIDGFTLALLFELPPPPSLSVLLRFYSSRKPKIQRDCQETNSEFFNPVKKSIETMNIAYHTHRDFLFFFF